MGRAPPEGDWSWLLHINNYIPIVGNLLHFDALEKGIIVDIGLALAESLAPVNADVSLLKSD